MSAGQGPAGRGGDAERLAAAIEQGTTPGEIGDAELARDLEIVAMLRSRSAAFDPHPADRARAKQRLMAVLAQQGGLAHQGGTAQVREPAPHATELTAPIRLLPADAELTAEMGRVTDEAPAAPAEHGVDAPETVAVEAPDVAAPRTRRAGRHSRPSRAAARPGGSRRPTARGLRRRVAAVGAVALIAMIAIAGAGSFMSRDALPGDALYAMKRLSESTATAFTFDEQARALRHLQLASVRLEEMEQLIERGSVDGAASPDAELFETAMREFDSSTGEGSRMLLAADDASGPAALGDLQAWASEQAARLSVMRSSLPDLSVSEADDSIALLDRLLGRTEALGARSTCSEVTSSTVDDLGRLPAEGTCSPRTATTEDPAEDTEAAEAEDGTETTTPEDSSTSDSEAPSTDTSTPEEPLSPDLLPELGPDGLPLPGTPGQSEGLSTSTPDGAEDGRITLPLPLLGPIQLPPLLPGTPGTPVGG